MKVITTTPLDTKTTAPHVHHSPTTAIPPSSTEDEAKIKFISALEKGVDKLLSRGHGRDRISEELLNEIANGCSPNENEVGDEYISYFIYGREWFATLSRTIHCGNPYIFVSVISNLPSLICILLLSQYRFFKQWNHLV